MVELASPFGFKPGSRMALTNLRSINNKIAEVALFLEDYKHFYFCVIETWLTKEDPDSLFLP